jgi:hypothetical protein
MRRFWLRIANDIDNLLGGGGRSFPRVAGTAVFSPLSERHYNEGASP